MKSEWRTFLLEDVCEKIYSGGTPSTKHPEYWDGNIRWLSSGETSQRFIYDTERKITQLGVDNSSTKLATEGCTVIATAGQGYTRGQASFLMTDTYMNQSVIACKPNANIIDPLFLYYNLDNRYEEFRLLSDGTSTRGGLSGWILKRMKIIVPPLQEQCKIVGILANIDRKIELNNAINRNLEQQARTLLKLWQADNEGCYDLSSLSEVAAINIDTYSPKEGWEYVNYLDTSSITEGVVSAIQRIVPATEKLPSRARRKIVANDVVFSTVRPNQRHFGIISRPLPQMLASTGFAVIRSKDPKVCNELIYLCLTDEDFIEKMQQLAEQSTSTFPSIKPSDLGDCKIPCAHGNEADDLTETLIALFSLISANQSENNSLAVLRDAVLPRLMSGELDVSAIGI